MSDHLSEHLLERRALGLLEGERLAQAEAHLAGCDACRAKLTALQSEQRDFNQAHDSNVFARRVLARVERENPQPAQRFNWTWLAGLLAPAVAMALLVIIRGPVKQDDAYLGTKGGVRLELFSPAGKLAENATVHPGDSVRFGVAVPEAGYVLVLGLNEEGELFPYYPLQGTASVAQPATQEAVLPGSVVLDEKLGHERFYLLRTDHPVQVSEVEAAVKAGHVKWTEPQLPIHGEQSSVVLDKTAP